MNKLVSTALVLVVALSAACQPNNDEVLKKLDVLTKKVDDLDKRVGAGGGRPAQPPMPAAPDPNLVYAVPVAGSPAKGPPHAKVTIVEAFEFACPFCDRVRATLDQLQKDYGDDLRVVHKQYVVHPQVATLPAVAACAAAKQGKYSVMEKLLWEKGYNNNRNFSPENIDAIAKEAGLDMTRFKADVGGECPKTVQQEQETLSKLGVRGTPAFFINGRYLSGAQPIENFKRIIDEELKKANEAVSKGTKVEDYYTEVVLKRGKPTI